MPYRMCAYEGVMISDCEPQALQKIESVAKRRGKQPPHTYHPGIPRLCQEGVLGPWFDPMRIAGSWAWKMQMMLLLLHGRSRALRHTHPKQGFQAWRGPEAATRRDQPDVCSSVAFYSSAHNSTWLWIPRWPRYKRIVPRFGIKEIRMEDAYNLDAIALAMAPNSF